MLLSIREKTKSWLAWLIVILISIPFALFGIESYFSTNTNVVVASVNGEEILLPEYQNAYNQYRSNLRRRLGTVYDPKIFDNDVVKKNVVDDLVDEKLIEQHLQKMHYTASDSAVAQAIKNDPSFQTNGAFNAELYRRIINSRFPSEQFFEARIKNNLMLAQLEQSFVSASFNTKQQIEKLGQLSSHSRTARILTISDKKVKINREITEQDLTAHYEQNKQLYLEPEMVKVAYIELSSQALAKNIKVTTDELQQAYQINKSNLLTSEARDVSHIMILMNKRDSNKKALRKINRIRTQITKGANFARTAKLKSDDTGSADAGGRLGFREYDTLDPAFAETLFKMKVGEISRPIRSKFGYHIIKLHRIKTPEIKTFAQSKAELLTQQIAQKAQTKFGSLLENFSNIAYEQSNSLEPLADELNLTIKTSDWVNRAQATGIFSKPKVINAIFSDDVLQQSQNSEVLEIDNEHLLVLRIIDHRKQSYKTIDSAKPSIERAILVERNLVALTKKGEQLIQQLKDGEKPKVIAKKLRLKWQTTKNYTLQSNLSPTIKKPLFAMPNPKTGITYLGVAGKKYTIIALTAINYSHQLKSAELKKLQANLDDSSGNYSFKLFVSQLKTDADVTVNYQQILTENPLNSY